MGLVVDDWTREPVEALGIYGSSLQPLRVVKKIPLNVWQHSSLPPISGSVKPSLLHYRYTRFVPATGQRNQAVFASETMIA